MALLTSVLLVQLGFMCALFVLSIIVKRNDIADIAWGPGIALASYTSYFLSDRALTGFDYILLTIVSIWALRIGVRILRKNLRKGEDPRYKRWRDSWGALFYPRSFVQVYLLQGALMLVLAYPLTHAAQHGPQITLAWLLPFGALCWAIGFYFEARGDYELDRFITNPDNKGKLMRYGLWRYSRHPNYFGEIVMWWSIGLITLTLPYGYLALISPITITLLIRYVSGVPLLEEMFQDHPEWADYARTTNMLLPWWPKHAKDVSQQ